ncbi:MAG: diphthamide biosynthesis enzyme Dph2 [Candidatus Nanohalarchaeota archaeon]|nr:MAG: diphthamide biosynthesis enzyme Dph2 [Candidatus Nanohaloarchaeota archaeon]
MLSEETNRKIISILEKRKPKKVAITVPEGMKADLKKIAKIIESCNCSAAMIVEPCFGACDLRDYEAKMLGCDLLLHFGHSDFGLRPIIPTEYIECFSDFCALEILKNGLKNLVKYKKIALCSVIQHALKLEEIKKFLEQNGKTVFVPQSKKTKYPGQILGCDCSGIEALGNEIDCALFIGSGMFHPLRLLERISVPVLCVGPDKTGILDITKKKDMLLRRKIIRQKKFEYAQKIGLIASFKRGQFKKNIFELKEKIEREGKTVYLLAMDFIAKEKMLGLDVDMIVNTACPRIEEDDIFDVPIINVEDICFSATKTLN